MERRCIEHDAEAGIERLEITDKNIGIDIFNATINLNDGGIMVRLAEIKKDDIWIFGDYDGVLSVDRSPAYIRQIAREIRRALRVVFEKNPTALQMAAQDVRAFMKAGEKDETKN